MNNHHEYTIFDENGAFFRGQGGGAEDLARLVAVADPFGVLVTAYDKKRKVLRQNTVRVSAVGGVLQTWVDEDDFLKIDRITYKIAQGYLDRWVDVSNDLTTTTLPQGVYYCWARESSTDANVVIGSDWRCDLEGYLREKYKDVKGKPFFVYIPSTWEMGAPLPKLRGVFQKADQKSSSQMVSTNRKVEV